MKFWKLSVAALLLAAGCALTTTYAVYRHPTTALHKALSGEFTLRTRYPDAAQVRHVGHRRALLTKEGEIVLFSAYAKRLREKLEGLPYATRVTITLVSAEPGKVKEFDVRIGDPT